MLACHQSEQHQRRPQGAARDCVRDLTAVAVDAHVDDGATRDVAGGVDC